MANEFPKIFSDTGLPDQEAYLYARVKYLNLSTDTLEDITQADVASIAWTVKTKLDGGAVANGTFTASDVIFDSLLDSADISESNFRARFAGTCFPTGATVYQVRVVITLAGSPANTCEIVANYTTKPVV